jgi:hypothetical protein
MMSTSPLGSGSGTPVTAISFAPSCEATANVERKPSPVSAT